MNEDCPHVRSDIIRLGPGIPHGTCSKCGARVSFHGDHWSPMPRVGHYMSKDAAWSSYYNGPQGEP